MAEINLGRVVGPRGLQGEQGETGPQGPAGADGAKGDPGPNQVSASTKTEGFEDGQTLYSEGGFVRAKTLTASDVGAFAKIDIIPVANGGTGAKSTNDARKNLGLMCRTVVSTTDANGMVTIPVSEYGSSPVYAMACHTFQGTSLRIGDPVAGKVQVIVFNGTERLKNTSVRINLIYGGNWIVRT